ncbi:MAG: hypothetical protein JWR02_2514 [Mucilaginibacter sp.]|nr:hypothetical protein [Mucilaginibacter sp.]
MKKLSLKNLTLRLSVCLVALTTGFIIHSCKKDNSKTEPVITNPEVGIAKTWYESAYPVTAITDGRALNRSLNTANNSAGSSAFDLSQHIKPDWAHAIAYTRLNKKTVEIPIDPSVAMGMALKNNNTGQEVYKKENSKSSFLLINDGKKYHAYIMTIIADDAYLKNDKNKLARNSYSKRDADFTGVLLYLTPKGKFVNSYQYKNGKAIYSASKSQTATTPKQATIGGSKILRRELQTCTDWYADYYIDNEYAYTEYIGTTCDEITTLGDGSGGGGSGGGSGSSAGDDTGFLPPVMVSDPTIFGLDGSNAQVPDDNFDNYLNYISSQGLSFSDPGNGTATIDGVTYQGEFTYIYDASGNLVASYFSPDDSTGPFQMGMEYNLGNQMPGTNTTAGSIQDVGYGTPASYLGSGSTVGYTTATGGGVSPGTATNNIFSDPDNPIDAPDDPFIDLGIGVTNIPADVPLVGGRLIAATVDRRPAPPAVPEDMTYGTNGNTNGINSSEINLSDNALFNAMASLFHKCTFLDQGGLQLVGDKMISQFRAKSGGQFSDPVLNQRVSVSNGYQNFIQQAGNQLNAALRGVNGDLSQIGTITINTHPVFNGTYNKFHGLQILINDTEYTEIQIKDYNYINGHWSATLDITIHDDFGLDKNDALTYQTFLGANVGFADWWLLQHTRGYVPFETIVHLRASVTASF